MLNMNEHTYNYIFKGTDTRRMLKYRAQADTVIALYSELVNKGIISTEDGDPLEIATLENSCKRYEDFEDVNGDIDYNAVDEWLNKAEKLTDDEILTLITEQDGNAYYQHIYEWDVDRQEYVQVR